MRDFIKNFKREADGVWACIYHTELETILGRIQVAEGSRFAPGGTFMGVDVVRLLEDEAKKQTPLFG